jgi:hypothetical protein
VHLSALVPGIKAGVIDPAKVTRCALQITGRCGGEWCSVDAHERRGAGGFDESTRGVSHR